MKKFLKCTLLILLLVAVLAVSLVVVACEDNNITPPSDDTFAPKLTAEFDDMHIVYDTDTLESLKPYFTVIYTNENGESTKLTDFNLIGSLEVGSSKIAVNYQDLTVIVTITVLRSNVEPDVPKEDPKDAPKVEPKLTVTFDTTHTVYEGDSLDSLKPYLTVIYTDEYGTQWKMDKSGCTLIGSLSVGDNLIAVLCRDTMTTVTVNVVTKPTVTFVANGKIVAVYTYTKYHLYVTNPPIPVIMGYDGVWEDYTLTADSGDVTVNAIYTAKTYTVTFDYNGADGNNTIESMAVTYGQPIGALPTPTLTDYDFVGWYYNNTLVNQGDIWYHTYDYTLVANWKASLYDSHGLRYSLNDDNASYSVVGWNDTLSSELTIPETHLGMPVTVIESAVFRDCDVLTSVTIPDSVISIRYNAFLGCSNLVSVDMGNGVKIIYDGAFMDCVKLMHVTIPASVETIMSNLLTNCPSLESISVQEGNAVYHSSGNCLIRTETGGLVAGCKNSVIPTDGSVRRIGDNAFDGCIDLTEISIPDTVTHIGGSAFSNCVNLKCIVIPDSVIILSGFVFRGCSNLESVTLGNNVMLLMPEIFGDCSKLKSVTIPRSVRVLGSFMFAGCTNLESIIILNRENGFSIGSHVFEGCDRLSIYFEGTSEDWNNKVTPRDDSGIENVTVCFYSEETPILSEDGMDYDGNYWHWDADLPTVWKIKQ